MLQAFYDDVDIHTFTASIVLEKAIETVTKTDRQSAKATNFGLVYGQGARGFKEYARFGYGVELTLEQAQDFKDKFLKTYRGILRAQQEAAMLCRRYERTGEAVTTITLGGRRRLLSGFSVTPQNIVNSPVQGTGVDMLERSIWLIDSQLRRVGLSSTSYLVNAVYDEVLIECDEENALEVADITKSSMEAAAKFYLGDIPCSVDYGIGSSWKEAKP
jgi:DNA polymerase-1